MKLWSYWRSSCAYRVRIALGLKQLAYEYVPVNLIKNGGEQHGADFSALNPQRQVPVLELDGPDGQRLRLVQSIAIIEYLDEVFPAPPLLPATAGDRAHVRALAEIVNSGIQPLQNTSTLAELERLGTSKDARDAWIRTFMHKGLRALQAQAAGRAGAFLFGDSVSLADVYLAPQLYNARRFGVALDDFPTLLHAEASSQRLPAFAAALPEVQPDAQD